MKKVMNSCEDGMRMPPRGHVFEGAHRELPRPGPFNMTLDSRACQDMRLAILQRLAECIGEVSQSRAGL